jgi:hypothetical protein
VTKCSTTKYKSTTQEECSRKFSERKFREKIHVRRGTQDTAHIHVVREKLRKEISA